MDKAEFERLHGPKTVVDIESLIRFLRYYLIELHPADPQSTVAMALTGVAAFLQRNGAKDISRRFLELSSVFDNLTNGAMAPIVRAMSYGPGRGPDSVATWSYRGEVVRAVECLHRSGLSLKGAAEHVEKHYPVFARLKRNANASLTGSILEWKKKMDAGKTLLTEKDLNRYRDFFARHEGHSQTEFRKLGERILRETGEYVDKALI